MSGSASVSPSRRCLVAWSLSPAEAGGEPGPAETARVQEAGVRAARPRGDGGGVAGAGRRGNVHVHTRTPQSREARALRGFGESLLGEQALQVWPPGGWTPIQGETIQGETGGGDGRGQGTRLFTPLGDMICRWSGVRSGVPRCRVRAQRGFPPHPRPAPAGGGLGVSAGGFIACGAVRCAVRGEQRAPPPSPRPRLRSPLRAVQLRPYVDTSPAWRSDPRGAGGGRWGAFPVYNSVRFFCFLTG